MNKNGIQKSVIEGARVATLSKPDDLLGVLTWWSISEVLISREELRKRCEDLGIETKKFLINSRPRSAFRRALEEGESLNLVRKIMDNPEAIVFGIINEQADQAKLDLNYTTQDVVIFHKKNQELEFKLAQSDASEIRKKFEMYLNSFTSHEVRTMIHAELRRKGAFPVRDKGGLYFVGKGEMSTVEKVRALVDTFKNGSFVYVMGIRDEALEKEGMKRSWENTLEQEIKTMKQEIIKTLADTNNFRSGTLAKRSKTLADLKKKVEVYNGLFGSTTPEAFKELDDLLAQVGEATRVKFGQDQGKRKIKVEKKEEKPVELLEKVREKTAIE